MERGGRIASAEIVSREKFQEPRIKKPNSKRRTLLEFGSWFLEFTFSEQSRRFFKPIHAIEVLHGHAAGAPDKIVQGRQDDDPAANDADGDVEEVAAQAVLGGRDVRHDPDKLPLPVIFAIEIEPLFFGKWPARYGVDGGENAAIHRNQVRRENNLDSLGGHVRQRLIDLRRVPVLPNVIRGHAFIAFRKVRVQLGRSSGPGDTALTVDDDGFEIDMLAGYDRRQTQNGGLRIT